MKEPPGASSLIPGSLNIGVSNEVEPFDGCSWEDVSSEFRGVVGRSGGMEGSDREHLYFFSKNIDTGV